MDSFVSSVAPQAIYLDGMDNSNLAHCVSICYWYENDNRNSDNFFAPAETLKCAFYKTMEEIPILAGHIKTDPTGRMYVKIDKENLNMPIYTDVCCDMDYSTMIKNGFNVYKLPMDLREDFGVPAPPGLIGGQIKLARIRIIRFRNNSGVLVYASIAHGIVDGHGYTQIMNRWAEISRWMLQSQDAKATPFPVRQLLYDRNLYFGKSKTYSQDEFKQELTDKALSDLALKVHQVISSVNEQVIGQFGFLQNKEPDGFMWPLVGYAWERNKLVMTNQSRFDHYGVDFGAGIPKIVRHAPHAFTDTVYVMPVHPATGGYLIEFKIAPKIEANIIRDSRWMKLVDRYDNYM
ncbi:hypothetical protein EV177_004261 [Coemansia sp. RSA 1804]|nr:hypothetical protein EV177_004261 [Coemansia sp. RSA 1804]